MFFSAFKRVRNYYGACHAGYLFIYFVLFCNAANQLKVCFIFICLLLLSIIIIVINYTCYNNNQIFILLIYIFCLIFQWSHSIESIMLHIYLSYFATTKIIKNNLCSLLFSLQPYQVTIIACL